MHGTRMGRKFLGRKFLGPELTPDPWETRIQETGNPRGQDGLGTRMAYRVKIHKNGPFRASLGLLEGLIWQHRDAADHIFG